jgi:hypothetical protein
MTKPPVIFAEMRARAEQVFDETLKFSSAKAPPLTPQECSRLIQELSIHQIQLEMQN